jgi:hypothetical protein
LNVRKKTREEIKINVLELLDLPMFDFSCGLLLNKLNTIIKNNETKQTISGC